MIFYQHYWLARPIGSGPAGPAVPHASFGRAWTDREIFVVGLGDSVTAGFGARKGYSYFDRLISNPPDEWADLKGICLGAVLPRMHYTNLAVSGSVSAELVEAQLPRVPTVSSNTLGLIFITTGGNDLIHNYGRTPPRENAMYGASFDQISSWAEHFAGRLDGIVTDLNARFPGGCRIFLADIFDPTDGVGDTSRAGLPPWPDSAKVLDAWNQVIHRFVAANPEVHLVKVHDTFLGHGIHCTQFWSNYYQRDDPHYWYYENLEDPNERGYDVIRRLFLLEMAKEFNAP